ncbi:MAG: hypothetical protein ACRD6X_07175 [Pyrinomonadaceae bacterium]
MANEIKMTPQETSIQAILAAYLTSRNVAPASTDHLDHDELAAFTEGNLTESEARPIVSHLADCSFCRHITAELVRLDLQFADEPLAVSSAPTSQPAKISEVLSGLLSKMFGTGENAVFAHNEDEEKKESEEEKDKDE